VRDPDGEPLADCKVGAIAGATWSTGSACTAGEFSLRHLPAGDIEVVVTTDEQSPLGARTWKSKTRIERAERRHQDLSWPKGITLDGVVITDGGELLADARLSAAPDWPVRAPDRQVIVRADRDGHFTFRHLVPGHWVVEGDLRTAPTAKVGKLDIDATADRSGLRLIVTEPRRN
jgi:hypothetical protein